MQVGEALAEMVAEGCMIEVQVRAILHAAAGKKPIERGLQESCFACFASFVLRLSLLGKLELNRKFLNICQELLLKLLPVVRSLLAANL